MARASGIPLSAILLLTDYVGADLITIATSSGRWDPFARLILGFLEKDRIRMNIDGLEVVGFRSPDTPALWVRDHSDILRGGCFIEQDSKSVVECFASTQARSGRIFDYVTTFPEKKPCERENWEKWVRVPVEADVEYRFVKAGYLAWRNTGDHAWMKDLLPAFDRALNYCMTHPWRWDEKHGLMKRPYTIDTWDFDYTAGREPWLNFAVTEDTFWGIFHGDNSGFFESARLLARMYRFAGEEARAGHWERTAGEVQQRANRLLFNGRFYRHFHKLGDFGIDGVDEEEQQLSLSNPMAINREMATPEMAMAVIEEYQRRKDATGAFAEWFSIDPPFPDGVFGDEKLVAGAYINGGIYPLAGGELARAALSHGFEQYGIAILDQYREMITATGETYLWYFPDGTASTVETSTSPEATPTDGWGSSAMLYGLIEGLCGVTDNLFGFTEVTLSPRWAADGEQEASVKLQYAESGAAFGYQYRQDENGAELEIEAGDDTAVNLHLLLPEQKSPASLRWNDQPAAFETRRIGASTYIDARSRIDTRGTISVRWR